jgi:hypothetical protein
MNMNTFNIFLFFSLPTRAMSKDQHHKREHNKKSIASDLSLLRGGGG